MAEKHIGGLVSQVLDRHDAYPTLTLWFDGSCESKNPGGIATAGWLIKDFDGQIVASGCREVCRGDGATNNVAEWHALGFGLRWMLDNHALASKCSLTLLGDSQLVVNQLNGTWACNKEHLQKLRTRCLAILEELNPPKWVAMWIPREQNSEADALSRKAYVDATGKAYPERNRR